MQTRRILTPLICGREGINSFFGVRVRAGGEDRMGWVCCPWQFHGVRRNQEATRRSTRRRSALIRRTVRQGAD